MKRISVFLALLAVTVAAVATTASAAAPGSYTCSGDGEGIPGGTYTGLTVTGSCWFEGDVTIAGNLKVAPGAILNDHAFSEADVHVTGNALVGKGAVLGLGGYSEEGPAQTDTVVDGNVVADQPLSLYLSGITVHGNVVSNGGGAGPGGEFRNFPLKDDVIDGNLVVQGWDGGWLGVIRDRVAGNVMVANNAGVDPDAMEVQTNDVGGNLICQDNVPAAQVNPGDGGQLNTVGGHGIGECAGLTG